METFGKPSYTKNDCPFCKEWEDRDNKKSKETTFRECQKCEKMIPRYLYTPNGFVSPQVDHWHFEQVQSIQGLKAIKRRLCWDCYIKDWDEMYSKNPEAERPNPPLMTEEVKPLPIPTGTAEINE